MFGKVRAFIGKAKTEAYTNRAVEVAINQGTLAKPKMLQDLEGGFTKKIAKYVKANGKLPTVDYMLQRFDLNYPYRVMLAQFGIGREDMVTLVNKLLAKGEDSYAK